MVKKKVGGAQRYKRAVAAGGGDAGGQGPADGPRPPQHVQRKISRKVKFLERVAASQKALASASGGVSKKRKRAAKPLPTLDSLAGALDEVAQKKGSGAAGAGKGGLQADRGRGSSVKRLKARRAIALSETSRVHAVKEHPSFKADPLAAIAHHLQATLPPPPKPVASGSKAKGARRGGAKKKGKGAQAAGDGMIE